MKDHYDFKNGKRGAIIPLPPNYSMVSIPLDNRILEWFGNQVDKGGGGDYLELINEALREYIRREEQQAIADLLNSEN